MLITLIINNKRWCNTTAVGRITTQLHTWQYIVTSLSVFIATVHRKVMVGKILADHTDECYWWGKIWYSQCMCQIHFQCICEYWWGKFWWIAHNLPNTPVISHQNFPVYSSLMYHWSRVSRVHNMEIVQYSICCESTYTLYKSDNAVNYYWNKSVNVNSYVSLMRAFKVNMWLYCRKMCVQSCMMQWHCCMDANANAHC